MKHIDIMNRDLFYFYNNHIYKSGWLKKLPITFSSNVIVGIDQSSTSTGICISDSEGNLFITEFVRNGTPISKYNNALVDGMYNLLVNVDVKYFVYEEHNAHIAPLESVINTVTDSLKKFSVKFNRREIEVHGAPPTVWRSGFLPREEYEGCYGRKDVKRACVNESIKRVPALEKYIKYSNKDFDGFEAYGICEGFKALNFSNDGTRIVNRFLKQHHARETKYRIIKIKSCNLDDEVKRVQTKIAKGECPIVLSNPIMQLDEAVNRISGLYKECVMVYKPSLEYCRLILETMEILESDEMYIVYIRRV